MSASIKKTGVSDLWVSSEVREVWGPRGELVAVSCIAVVAALNLRL